MTLTGTMTKTFSPLPDGVEVARAIPHGCDGVITAESLAFVAALDREFRTWQNTLLETRARRQEEINGGQLPDFPFSTTMIRKGPWRAGPIPKDLLDRRVEITAPPDRRMIIHAMNSGANVYMADFEDSMSPTWDNVIRGQANLREAVRQTIEAATDGKTLRLKDHPAVLMMRPRGLHLREPRVLIDSAPVSASIFDFGMYFFHNARELIERGSGPYVYLPKLEHQQEARWWNSVFCMAQDLLHIPRGTVRATVLIETIPAAFEMEEILYELRDHAAGMNCGRWDYIFSCIKTFSNRREFLFPERSELTMNTHFLRAYSQLLIQVCHRRGVHAIGGMAAAIPLKGHLRENAIALKKVRIDKEREVLDGHDGTWVAHPDLVPLARGVFDGRMKGPNQLYVTRDDVYITAKDLLDFPVGTIGIPGVTENISVALQYLSAWLRGTGCVAINNLMEDTATAEICRIQLWHWLHHPAVRLSGTPLTERLYRALVGGEIKKRRYILGEEFDTASYSLAASLLDAMVLNEQLADEFLTLRGLQYLN